jgi:hypothetical protein
MRHRVPFHHRPIAFAAALGAGLLATGRAAAGEPPADQGASSAVAAPEGKEELGPGVHFSFGTDVAVLAGAIAQGWTGTGAYALLSIRAGYYFTDHLGLIAGVQAGTGGLLDGCGSSTCSNAVAFQFPLLAQWAFDSRSHGPYVEGGIALAPTYIASTQDGDGQSPAALRFDSPLDLKLGVGYRWRAPHGAFELRAELDVGRFTYASANTAEGFASADIPSNQQAFHGTGSLGFAWIYGR